MVGALIECLDEAKLNRSTEILRAWVCAECSILNTIAACSLSNFEQSASANERILSKQGQVEENDYAENTLDWRNLDRRCDAHGLSGFTQVVGNTIVGNIKHPVY
jgi:hypothetical protein